MMSFLDSDHEESGRLADLLAKFVAELRAGNSPRIDEFCRLAGDDAGRVRPLLETVLSLEAARPAAVDSTQSCGESESPMPAQLGDFRLLREAGRGGMGVVYEATELALNRRVAVKVLDQRTAKGLVAMKRFLREAQAAAMLHHTNIVPVFSVGEDHGLNYYVMPFIEGDSLAGVLRQLQEKYASEATPAICESDLATSAMTTRLGFSDLQDATVLSISDGIARTPNAGQRRLKKEPSYYRRVAEIGLQIAEALRHAQQQGVLHRDIKPSNLLLAADGTVWVTDFGLARLHESNDLTSTGEVLGTLRYLAPERLKGVHTIQGDLYGLGMVMFELLTLTTPFEVRERPELLRRILESGPGRPRSIDPDIPSDLETIVCRAIARDPQDRYAAPQELIDDLRAFLSDLPIRSQRNSAWKVTVRWCRRNRTIAALCGFVSLLLLVISLGSFLWADSLRRERDLARDAESRAREAAVNAVAATQRAHESEAIAQKAQSVAEQANVRHLQELYRAWLTEMKVVCSSGRVGQQLHGLAAADNLLNALPWDKLTPSQQQELRNATIACLSQSDLVEEQRLHMAGPASLCQVDPTFRYVAVPTEPELVIIRRIDGTEPDIILSESSGTDRYVTSCCFSPCGRWLLANQFAGNGSPNSRRLIWDWRRQAVVVRLPGDNDRFSFCFDQTGENVWLVEDAVIRRFDLTSGEPTGTSPPKFKDNMLALSPDGTQLVTLKRGYALEIIDPQTWTAVNSSSGLEPCRCVSWSPSDGSLIAGTNGGRLMHWTLDAEGQTQLPVQHDCDISGVVCSPSGIYFASTDVRKVSKIHHVAGRSEVIEVAGEVLAFSPDDQRVAVAMDDHMTIHRILPSKVMRSIREAFQYAEFSPDDCWLAASGNQGVLLYGSDSLQLKADLGLDFCGPVTWRPDGSELNTFGMFTHLARWPVISGTDADQVSLGPPRSVSLNPLLARIGADPQIPQHGGRHAVWQDDGQLLYYTDNRDGRVFRFDPSRQTVDVFSNLIGAARLSVSHGGQFIAAASIPVEALTIWTSDGGTVLELPIFGTSDFSPDGRWMATASRNEIRLYETQHWNCVRSWSTDDSLLLAGACVSFSPNSMVLAAGVSARCVRLFDLQILEAAADLTFRRSAETSWLSFSADGSRLVVTRPDEDICVWDLGALREQLESIGQSADFLPAPGHSARELQVSRIDRGTNLYAPDEWWKGFELLAKFELWNQNFPDAIDNLDKGLRSMRTANPTARAQLLAKRGQYQLMAGNMMAAVNDFQSALSIQPDDVATLRRLAEILVAGPPEVQEPEAAISLLQRLCISNDAVLSDQLNLICALIQTGRIQAADEHLMALERLGVPTSTTLDRIRYDCLRCNLLRRQNQLSEVESILHDIQDAIVSGENSFPGASVLDSLAPFLEIARRTSDPN